MSESTDRVTVGVTRRGQENLDAVMRTGYFESELDVYRCAIAVGIAASSSAPPPITGGTTKFNVGTLDRDGQVSALVSSFFGRQRVIARAEALADVGLGLMAEGALDGSLMDIVTGSGA